MQHSPPDASLRILPWIVGIAFFMQAGVSAVSSFIFFQPRHTTGFARRAPKTEDSHAPV